MEKEKEIMLRLSYIEDQLAPLEESAKALKELREDVTPRVNEAVRALIEELADIEADFQIEDLVFLIKKTMRNVRNLIFVIDRMKNLIDFATTAEPLLKSTVPQIIAKLDELEQKGVFRILNSMMVVVNKIADSYSPEDIEQIGEGVVGLLGAVKKLTSPQSIEFLDKLSEVPSKVDLSEAKSVGIFSMPWTMADKDVKKGIGVTMELLKGLAAVT
ncbi:MAG: DUF1641 domain-containing protein [Deltaproteobacteria bacterium]|nr:MAG: DUF1641 domain-containing protein [Deltaproteobacteria bacterium]